MFLSFFKNKINLYKSKQNTQGTKRKDFFIVKATEYALSVLERKLDLQINCTFEEELPKDTPILFVANHFTRSETLLMPYIIKKYTGKLIRTLADKELFRSKFLDDFLTKAKVVSTGDEDRDDKIIADLLSGKELWMIYPEGKMIKDKNVFVETKYGEPITSARTGSAVLALKTELLRQKILKNEINYSGDVSKNGLVIVPFTITYHPLILKLNWLEELIKKTLKRSSSRLDEELRVETSILTNSKIDLFFSRSIKVSHFIADKKPSPNIYDSIFGYKINSQLSIKTNEKQDDKVLGYSLTEQEQTIINALRHTLTANFMKTIYDNTLITLDHFYAFVVFYCVENKIGMLTINQFKDILCTCYFKALQKFDDFYRFTHYKNEFNFITSQDFETITDISILQGLVIVKDNNILFNTLLLDKNHDFNHIRSKNILKMLHNELLYFKDVKTAMEDVLSKTLQSNALLTKLSLDIARSLYEIDIKNFDEDYNKFFNHEETKSRKITSPFFKPAFNGSSQVGVVLSHGYKSAPEEVRLLAEYLASKNINVYVVRLKGHGTGSENMKYIRYNDWVDSFRIGYEFLSRKCDKVFICGFSTGGLLSLVTAYNSINGQFFGKKPAGVISINAALKIADIKFKFVRFAKLGVDLVNKFRSKEHELKDYVVDQPENPHINYSKNYLNGLNELSKLIEYCDSILPQITYPAFIIQGSNDPVVLPESGEAIFNKIGSLNKNLYKPNRHRHVIVRGAGCEEVFIEIEKWICKVIN